MILFTFKKIKFKFYLSTEGRAYLLVLALLRYVLLIIDKLQVEFSILMPLVHLPLETTNRFIYPRHFFRILLSFDKPLLNPKIKYFWRLSGIYLERYSQLGTVLLYSPTLLLVLHSSQVAMHARSVMSESV